MQRGHCFKRYRLSSLHLIQKPINVTQIARTSSQNWSPEHAELSAWTRGKSKNKNPELNPNPMMSILKPKTKIWALQKTGARDRVVFEPRVRAKTKPCSVLLSLPNKEHSWDSMVTTTPSWHLGKHWFSNITYIFVLGMWRWLFRTLTR